MLIISDTDFDPFSHLKTFTNASRNAGAITSFIGRVRSENECVDSLFLESYQGVTEAGIEMAITSAESRWPLIDTLILHRVGIINAGEPIVLVACASEHRRAAFEACDFLMDYLKTEAIFWKKQISKNGAEWVEPRTADYQDNKRWST